MKKSIKFTKQNLEKIKHTDKLQKYYSTNYPSLCLFVQPEPSLNKSYYAHWSVVRYKKDGTQKRQGRYKLICRYGSKTIEAVNKIVISGIDKWKIERSTKSKAATVETLVRAFIKDGVSGFRVKGKTKIKYKKSTIKDYKTQLGMYVLLQTKKQELISMLTDPFRYSGDAYSKGALKDISLKDISKRDIEIWHSRMEEIPVAANRALAILSVAFEWDMDRKTNRLYLKDNNPCLRIDKFPEHADKGYIDTIEKVLEVRNYCLSETWRDPHFLTFYCLDLECGERLTDLYGLAWNKPLRAADMAECSGWVNLRTEQLHLLDSKNRKPATIFLTEEAVKILTKLQELKAEENTNASFAAGSIWIFPRPSDPTKHINENSYRCKLRDFHFKFGMATRELVKVNKLKNGKNGKRKVYKYKLALTMKHLRKTFVTYFGREHGEEAASQRMRHSTLKVTRDHYFNADNKKLKVKHMYSTGDNVVQLKKAGNNEQ
jgi:hypothetical protein|tara:strand:- start:649 stop:2112 length:1464 start_codon:yes stop_codon:yes gene_type:complete